MTNKDEYDQIFSKGLEKLNLVWPKGMSAKDLPNYPEIKRLEEEINKQWIYDNANGTHDAEKFRTLLRPWGKALLDGIKFRRQSHAARTK